MSFSNYRSPQGQSDSYLTVTLDDSPPSTPTPSSSVLIPSKVVLTKEIVMNLSIAKIFKLNHGVVDKITYTSDGTLVVTSASDDQLNVYDCVQGTHKQTCNSKRFGCALATFTHSPTNILYASTKEGDELRYLSLHDNKFIHHFTGHSAQVTNLSMSPTDDTFITSSLDKTTRVWDLRSPKCSGYLNILEPAVCSIDPEGLLFAVGIGSDTIKLFDMRSYGKGPFVTFRLPKGRDARAQWTSLEFSPQGECILINTTGPFMYVAGSFQGNLHFELQGRICFDPTTGGKLDAGFSANGDYILSTSGDGSIILYNAKDGRHITNLNPYRPSAIGAFKFNPKMLMMTTAARETAFWLPRTEID